MCPTGRGKRAGGTKRHKESQEQEWSCPLQGGDHLKSFLPVLARCSSILSAWSRSFNLYSSSYACPRGFSVDAPRISSEGQLLADLLL